MLKKKSYGFSLIEIMIVVAIIGILASVAYPSYMSSILKGRRAEGKAALLDLMQQQERFMTQTNSYCAFSNTSSGTVTAVSGCTTVPFKTFSGDSLAKSAYYLSAEACTGSTIKECVRLSATPLKTDDVVNILRLSSTGTKECTGTGSPSQCW